MIGRSGSLSAANVAGRFIKAAIIPTLFATLPARADHALQCDKVQLPSSLVICSDPDLLAIADERSQVYGELWARLDDNQRQALKTDQDRWVREYATNCGVPPNVPPQLPPSSNIKECFKQAGQERISFLRTYLSKEIAASPSNQPHSNPSIESNLGDEIPLVNNGGIYMIPVLLNGFLPLQFIVDSGAADVVLPADVVLTLIRTGTIVDSDFIGEQYYRLADGSIMRSTQFFLHEVKVGNHSFNRVLASVSRMESRPLLGQSFLSKVGAWSINNERHVLVLSSPTTGRSPDGGGAAPIAPMLPIQQKPAAFQAGLRDRTAWEQWFAQLTGNYKEGAEYWAGQRSLTNPGSCFGPAGQRLGDWTTGCLEAQRFFTPTDIRRKSEPAYRDGWNSYSG